MYSALLQTDLEQEWIVCGNDDHKRHTNGRQGIDSRKPFEDPGLPKNGRERKGDDKR